MPPARRWQRQQRGARAEGELDGGLDGWTGWTIQVGQQRDRQTQDDGVCGSGRRLERQSFAPKESWEWQTGKDRLASSMYVCRPPASRLRAESTGAPGCRVRVGVGSW